jgi:hypothetical protein
MDAAADSFISGRILHSWMQHNRCNPKHRLNVKPFRRRHPWK